MIPIHIQKYLIDEEKLEMPLELYSKNVNSSKNEVLALGVERAHREYPVKSLIYYRTVRCT